MTSVFLCIICYGQKKTKSTDEVTKRVSIGKKDDSSTKDKGNEVSKKVSIGTKDNSKSSDEGSGEVSISSQKHDILLAWMEPFEEYLETEEDYFQISAKAFSDVEIIQSNFSVLINDEPIGSKSGEYNLFGTSGEYTYKNLIPLKHGENKVEVIVTLDGNTYKSPSKVFNRTSGISGAGIGSTIFWQRPDPLELDDATFACKDEKLDVGFRLLTAKSVKLSDIEIIVNEKAVKPSGSAVLRGSEGNYLFKDQLTLEDLEGIHVIRLQVQGESSIPLRVNYSPFKPNLYVLSVGTKTNLQYTVKDARDFVSVFEEQGGSHGNRLFHSVTTDLLLGEDAVTSEISGRMEELGVKVRTNNIHESDVILVFLSSHGFMMDGEFRLQGEDYNPARKRSSSVSYENMLASLDEIPCKKVVFIDACHSGGAKANVANINHSIETLNSIKSGLTVIASSTADEQSYEDDAWKNGAFTQSIISGLSDGKADTDKDDIITVDELFKYLTSAVPYLVKKVKSKDQHPTMINNDLGEIPIYVVK
jgi:hypothetical protein